MSEVLWFSLLIIHCQDQVTQQSNQTPQVSNQSTQQSNQSPQQSNQSSQQSNQVAPEVTLSLTEIEAPTINPEILPVTTANAASTKATTTAARVYTTTFSATTTSMEDDTDDNTCSTGTNNEIFFEQVEILNNEYIDCSNEFNAEDAQQYPTSTEAFQACQKLEDCIGVTSTNHVIRVSNMDSNQLNFEIENVEIVNFLPPTGFDFNHDKVFVKHCFSMRQTDTSEFKELETLDCNAEVVCSDGYRKKNFDCVDIDECKLDHDCTFEGKTFYSANIFGQNL